MKPLGTGAPTRGAATPVSSDMPSAAINGTASERTLTDVSLNPDRQAVGKGLPIGPPGRNRSDAECRDDDGNEDDQIIGAQHADTPENTKAVDQDRLCGREQQIRQCGAE